VEQQTGTQRRNGPRGPPDGLTAYSGGYAAVVFLAPHDAAENAGLEVRRPFVMLRAGAIGNG
jgi:hypothetical protein